MLLILLMVAVNLLACSQAQEVHFGKCPKVTVVQNLDVNRVSLFMFYPPIRTSMITLLALEGHSVDCLLFCTRETTIEMYFAFLSKPFLKKTLL